MLSKLYLKTLNPFNIRYSKNNPWLGSYHHSPINGFVAFLDEVFGLRAGILLLLKYRKLGLRSVKEIVTRFAPPSENDTNSYIDFVSDVLLNHGCNPDNISCSDLSFFYLCRAIAKYETGYQLDLLTYNYVCYRFNIDVK